MCPAPAPAPPLSEIAFKFGPTAAVALIGPRSVGKKLIATGLAECINTQQLCPGIVLVSRFNGGLTKSPIVWIDEGIPKGGDGIDFADTFRNLVTGGKLPIEEKGKERTDVAGVHRVVITANNYKTIAQLGEDQVRDGDDLDAIGERLVVFRLQQRAADYLASIDTTGWIAGDNGAPSQFVIARHLLWHLYNTVEWIDGKPRRLGRRLLYEGRRDVVRAVLDTNSAKDAVCAAVLNAITRGHETVRFFQGRLWIEPVAFMSALGGARQLAFAERERLEQAMRALAPKIDKSREFRGTSKDGQAFPLKCARWFLWQDIERLEESVGPLPTEAKTLLDAGNVEAGR